MEVRCEKCKTTYPLDNSQVGETGSTVKCENCGHIFRVKVKSLVVTVPAKPEEMTGQYLSLGVAKPPVSLAPEPFFQLNKEPLRVAEALPASHTGEWETHQSIADPHESSEPVWTGEDRQQPTERRAQNEGLEAEDLSSVRRGGGGRTAAIVLLVASILGIALYLFLSHSGATVPGFQAGPARAPPHSAAPAEPLPFPTPSREVAPAQNQTSAPQLLGAAVAQPRPSVVTPTRTVAQPSQVASPMHAAPPRSAALPPPQPSLALAKAKSSGLSPTNSRALIALAKKLRDRGRSEQALELYGRVVALEPNNATALAGRGWCYVEMSQYASAEASFQAALGAQPHFADALMGLAETYRYESRRGEAVKYYRKYLEVHPRGEDAVAARNAIEQLKE